MIRGLIALAFLAASPALAQTQPPAATPPATVKVALDTAEGRIVLEVETGRAPITAGNFLHYVDQHRLDGVNFYRVVKVQDHFGFVQFGVQNAPKRVLPPIKHEPTSQTGIKHTDFTVSTGRLEPGTARGDFTIVLGDQPSFDADPSRPGDNLGYAAFAHVIEGKDVVEKIFNSPVSPTSTDRGAFKGEMLEMPVKILKAARLP